MVIFYFLLQASCTNVATFKIWARPVHKQHTTRSMQGCIETCMQTVVLQFSTPEQHTPLLTVHSEDCQANCMYATSYPSHRHSLPSHIPCTNCIKAEELHDR